MRYGHVLRDGRPRLAVAGSDSWTELGPATRLSQVLAEATGDPASALTALEAIGPTWAADEVALGAPLDRPQRIFCVGRNYVAHRDEFHNRPTEWPEVFLRLASTVTGPFDDVVAPAQSDRLDYEGELGVVIGAGGRHIAAADAERHILGFVVVNDLTARDWQHRGGQWTAGKNFDATLPVGPALVTPDELDPHDAELTTVVSGEPLQSARTSQLIFSIAETIEFISSWTALMPGDLIATGTPGGVGIARRPPRVLVPGDVVEVSVAGVGTIRNRIVADERPAATERWTRVAAEATVGRT